MGPMLSFPKIGSMVTEILKYRQKTVLLYIIGWLDFLINGNER